MLRLPLEVRDLTSWPDAPEVVEDGATFEANARKKATELGRYLKHWVIGEDSGLVVPALNGRPGVYSARYAGRQGDDAANDARLLAELAPLPGKPQPAYYVCTVALADPHGEVQAVVAGQCHGVMIGERRGGGGFGYDPLFLYAPLGRSFATLSEKEKNAVSHRRRAADALLSALRSRV